METHDKEAVLSQWIYEHSPLVLRTAFYYVKDQMIAEDIAQEVFLRAFRKMEEYRAGASVSTWLYRITVNACKDYLKSWSFRKLIFTQKHREVEVSASAESEVIRKFKQDQLAAEVMKLPVKYREIIVLFYYEHLKTSEIAELIGIKEPNVRVRMGRALEKLNDVLTGGSADESYEHERTF